jgi:hypothetical protein
VIRSNDVRELLDDLFEETALAIGGLIAIHPVDDQVVARLFASLHVIRDKAMCRIEGTQWGESRPQSGHRTSEPHPAVEEFLARLGRD